VLDVILTDKSISCEKNHIRFGYMIDGEPLAFMSSMDLASLFGNVIDNAMEAVLKLDDLEKAVINLTIRTFNGVVFIHCENYYAGELHMVDGLPVTTKKEHNYHGYGIKSVQFVVDKYDGVMTIVPEDQVFNVNITIPIPAKA
jgi:sensor histidine kinase regulating citrate/malate metabolism